MLLNGDPKEESVFPVVLMTWLNDKSFSSEMIAPPRISKSKNGVSYVFAISGIIYLYFVSPGSISQSLEQCALRSNNELYLLHIPKESSADIFLKLFGIT